MLILGIYPYFYSRPVESCLPLRSVECSTRRPRPDNHLLESSLHSCLYLLTLFIFGGCNDALDTFCGAHSCTVDRWVMKDLKMYSNSKIVGTAQAEDINDFPILSTIFVCSLYSIKLSGLQRYRQTALCCVECKLHETRASNQSREAGGEEVPKLP